MIEVRLERAADRARIHEVVEAAFAGQPYAGGDEQDLVDRLRERGELALSLVAIDETGTVVGHIAFSLVTIEGRECGWYQLAPVAVVPDRQNQGIGRQLIEQGIAALRERGAAGIGVVGNPARYERFGFAAVAGFGPGGRDALFFRAMVLRGDPPRGAVRYASAFYG